jgi:hypothetical protein
MIKCGEAILEKVEGAIYGSCCDLSHRVWTEKNSTYLIEEEFKIDNIIVSIDHKLKTLSVWLHAENIFEDAVNINFFKIESIDDIKKAIEIAEKYSCF